MKRWNRLLCFGLVVASVCAFAPQTLPLVAKVSTSRQILFTKQTQTEPRRLDRIRNALDRLDTLKSAGLVDSGNSPHPLMMRGPGFKRIFFWLFVGFMWKWYRARYINKIPVWDRQPQWNMVITNREQEKDLKAYTCKNCGATLFIAKNREWFFKGDTGLGGLGCFTCGAKGEDNFVMDRDRILEDVGDDDDYFDYERPLDFVTAAERRALLKKAKGDENVANQMLVDQAAQQDSPAPPEGAMDAVIEKTTEETKQDEENKTEDETNVDEKKGDVETSSADAVEPTSEAPSSEKKTSEDAPKKKKKKKKKKKASESKEPEKAPEVKKPDPESISIDDLDALDMDAF